MQGGVLTCAAEGEMEAPPQVVRVKRELLAACLTCPLCKKLLRDATTISECLHTFCRKCIFEKLTDEEVDCCPICNIDLGCTPVEKLRSDHNLEDVRAKIFPFKRRKVNAPELLPSITLPVRRKERSLSSLVVNAPRVATQAGLSGRKTKASGRRASALRGLGPIIDESIKKEGSKIEDHAEDSRSSETLSKMTQNRRQNSSNVEAYNHTISKNIESTKESLKSKAELWKPLNCLVEAANRTKALKSGPPSPVIKEEQINAPRSEENMQKTKIREHPHKSKIEDDNNNSIPESPVKVRTRRPHGRKRMDPGTSAQALVDAACATRERRSGPIWLSLVPSMDQEGDAAPQTSACYLRIKDGNLPVSFIQKYLVMKLNLKEEAEVEITSQGQPVSPTLALHNLADLWLRPGPQQRVPASVGSSAKDFVMVLNYSRKAPAP